MKGSQRERKKRRAARYFGGYREELPRQEVRRQVKKASTEDVVIVDCKRLIDYP